MLAKKLAVLTTALAVSVPAFAHHGDRDWGRHDRGYHYGHERRVVVVQPQYYYRPAPRPVVVYQPVYQPVYEPRPVYYQTYQTDPATGAAVLVGAVLGAAIVHAAITGH